MDSMVCEENPVMHLMLSRTGIREDSDSSLRRSWHTEWLASFFNDDPL